MSQKSPILKSSVKSLPFNWYYKENHFKKELKKIWSNEWIYACHENNIKKPLSYVTLQISQFNIIILRERYFRRPGPMITKLFTQGPQGYPQGTP